jgi:uncharacterized membrane protein
MQPKLKRGELDHLAKFYSLDEARIETMFDITGARPTRAEGLSFLGACLMLGGLLSLAASVVFFVAANWSEIAIFGRFAMLELVLVACGVIAFVRPPPSFTGRAALFMAFITTGALLALFGQTYQTGADVYELFLGWSLTGLPLALIARWSVATAAWVLVLNTALALYCGWQPAGGLLWTLFGGMRLSIANALLIAGTINVALWFAADRWRRPATPDWMRRLILSCGFAFVTWSGILAVMQGYAEAGGSPELTLTGVAALMTVVSAHTLRQREDIYALAVVFGTFVIVSLVAIARGLEWKDEIAFFVLALWLIVTSTIGGRMLMSLMRRWRQPEQVEAVA